MIASAPTALVVGVPVVGAAALAGVWLGAPRHRALGALMTGAAAAIGVLLATSIASANASGVTPSVGMIQGKTYSMSGAPAAGVSSIAALTARLQAEGWSSVAIVSFASDHFTASGTWGGAQDAPVPTGIAITG